ncbi:MAG: DUF456 domain-containing protein [Planctomycetota bacterium]
MNWLDLTYYALLLFTGLLCVFVTIVGIPGLWVLAIAAIFYAWIGGWTHLAWPGLLTVLLLAVLAEVIEFVAGAAGSKQAGGSWRSMLGAIGGGLIGGLLATFLIPVPLIGSIIGAILGAAVGAVALELFVEKDWRQLTDVGLGAAKGRAIGILAKTGCGVVMWLFLVFAAWPHA